MFHCCLLTFSKLTFQEIINNTVKVPNGLGLDQVLIWVQTICKGYCKRQNSPLARKELDINFGDKNTLYDLFNLQKIYI